MKKRILFGCVFLFYEAYQITPFVLNIGRNFCKIHNVIIQNTVFNMTMNPYIPKVFENRKSILVFFPNV